MTIDIVRGHIDAAQNHRRSARTALAAGDQTVAEKEFRAAHVEISAGFDAAEMEEAPDASDPTEDDRELAAIFADLWGIRGGIYRDMAALDEKQIEKAVQAYDKGTSYERRFKLLSTYNFVNAIVLRILRDADLLSNPMKELTLERADNKTESATMMEWLRRADNHVSQSLPRRQDKAWAHADLVLLAALQPPVDCSARLLNFEQQVTQDGDTYPYESLLGVLRDLVKRPLPTKLDLIYVGEWIRDRLPATKRGRPLEVGS